MRIIIIRVSVVKCHGATRALTEGVTALLAAAILLYVGVWLHGKRHAHAWQAFIGARLQGALARGTLWALAGVSFLAVYREAFETVLFYQALWQQAGRSASGSIGVGLAAAVFALAAIAWLILRFGMRLPLFFQWRRAKAAIGKIHSWQPQRILLSHGRCFDSDADEVIRRIFGGPPH